MPRTMHTARPGGPEGAARLDSSRRRPRGERRAAAHAVGLIGAILLTAASLQKLPPVRDLLRVPATPFDYTQAGEAVQIYLFLTQAAPFVPERASVSFSSEPRDRAREVRWKQFAQALLIDRRICWAPEPPARTDVLIVAGARPPVPPGDLLFETPYGSVWKPAAR